MLAPGTIRLLFIEPVSDLGGVSQYIVSIIQNLPHERYNLYVAASGNGPLVEEISNRGVEYRSLPLEYSFATFPSSVVSLRRFLKEMKFDVVHAHTAKAAFVAAVANWGLAAKLVYSGHGLRFSQKESAVSKIIFEWIERFICTRASYVALLSQTELHIAKKRKLFRNGRVVVAPMTIDATRYSECHLGAGEATRLAMGLPEDAFVVGMVGRISFQKDPATFIETARIIASRISSARFVWVGDGDMRDDLMRKAGAAGIADKVLVTGQQDRGKIPSLLAAMNVLLFTSRFEGLPIVLLEAMAAKRFIVAANVGSIMDIIQNNITGWLFTPGDCRRAAQIVCDIQANENIFSGIREAAFRLVSEEYSPAEKLGIQFHQVYSSLVARS